MFVAQLQKNLYIISGLIHICLLLASGMTPLHCAAISHSVTKKALSASPVADVSLQKMAENKLICVQMLVKEGASLHSQVQYSSPFFELHVICCTVIQN